MIELFERSFNIILGQLDNFKGCSRVANDLSTASLMHDNPDGVIIAETLDYVFFQLDMITSDFNIGDDKLGILTADLSIDIRLLLDSFKKHDFEKVYTNLRDINYVWCKFQSYVFQTLKEKNSVGEDEY